MPLIILSGGPCCGKTTFASLLKTKLLESGVSTVKVINEESENIRKSQGYANSLAEKSTRAAIKSAVNVALNADTYVIVDSLNYIKGYRYELYCLSRSLRTPHCVCWIETSVENSVKWNDVKKTAEAEMSYTEEM